MLKNLNYNLMEEIVQLSKGLHRFDQYIEDAKKGSGGCTECAEIWQRMKQRHEEELQMLLDQLKRHIDDGVFEWEVAGAKSGTMSR